MRYCLKCVDIAIYLEFKRQNNLTVTNSSCCLSVLGNQYIMHNKQIYSLFELILKDISFIIPEY